MNGKREDQCSVSGKESFRSLLSPIKANRRRCVLRTFHARSRIAKNILAPWLLYLEGTSKEGYARSSHPPRTRDILMYEGIAEAVAQQTWKLNLHLDFVQSTFLARNPHNVMSPIRRSL